jgi:D-alanine-D-alanine ligase
MDKDISKKIFKATGINTAKWLCINSIDEIDYKYLDDMGYPVVVKPNCGGSSVATSIVTEKKHVEDAVKLALDYDREIIIEKYIKGDEVTCCILNGKVLPLISIRPKANFFDYTSKYADGGSEEIIVELEKSLQNEIEKICLKCWKVM